MIKIVNYLITIKMIIPKKRQTKRNRLSKIKKSIFQNIKKMNNLMIPNLQLKKLND